MINKPAPDLTLAIQALEKKSDQLRKKLLSYPSTKKFYPRSSLIAHQLRQKSSHILAGAGLIGSLLLTPLQPSTPSASADEVITHQSQGFTQLVRQLSPLIPHIPTKLDPSQASVLESQIESITGIKTKAILDGESLNHQVGYMGAEQHLPRYPGDTINQHDDQQVSGITTGKGAWGYFSPSKDQFTTQDYLREKYYVVAQTLYLPDWNTRFNYLRDWYKYRKVLVINPTNGSAVVADIADSGPADWTGKQFGGSPEVMVDLGLHTGPRKGLVLFLFVDDPNNLIPLGPVTSRY